MWREHSHPFVCLLLVVGWAGTAVGQSYSLCGNSGGQLHVGDGLMLPLQPPATAVTTMTVFPALRVPPAAAPGPVTGTIIKPLLMNGPKKGYQRKLVVPPGVLTKAAAQTMLGIHASKNPNVFAVATNLAYSWPAPAPYGPAGGATFSTGAAVPVMTVFGPPGGVSSMTYSNALGARFGGPAQFLLSPGAPAGLIAPPVTVYFKINGATPPCTHPAFGGATATCLAGLAGAVPAGPVLAGQGGATAPTVMTPGTVLPLNLAAIKMGTAPSGTIIAAAPVAFTPAIPTNMATSQPGPWTTGQVVIKQPAALAGAETFTLSGKDERTALGGGTIQFVSGALSVRTLSGANANRGWIRLGLKPASAPSSYSQTFAISGNSQNIPWSWRIAIGGDTVASKDEAAIPSGGPDAFATRFITSITAEAGTSGCSASGVSGFPKQFKITCTCDFEFYVTDQFAVEHLVTGALAVGVDFNPTIKQVVAGVPMLRPWALLGLGGVLLVMVVAFARRQRDPMRSP